ncbi:EAL domain-containing protein [Metabacillus sp. GX 13764]|uniref:GGDEF domain-containing phosphodiesterase n=1 Tax=Metabacillus kandeliae TaxID=2900151 RepID=UPI001E3AE4CB|nr:GGDEF domain-containing phosphodiesterase [Metabacillus kandeliae]MCD7036194.1 EAL domain-containing protein [Metabacillus kandeliae]
MGAYDADKRVSHLNNWDKTFQQLYSRYPDAILLLDSAGKIIHSNSAAERLLKKELLGQSCEQLFHLQDQELVLQSFGDAAKNGAQQSIEVGIPINDGGFRHCRVMFLKGDQEKSSACHFLAIRDVTEFKKAQDQIKHIAYYDELTGLPNYRAVHQKLNELTEEPNEEPAAVIKVNIDRFKYFNEVYGKTIGDRLLEEISKELLKLVPSQYFIGRFHNDEFVVIVHSVKDRESFYSVADEMAKQFKRKYSIQGQYYQANISIGAAFYPEHGKDPDSLLKNSEIALKAGKEDNGLKEYSEEKSYTFQRRYYVQKELYLAMQKGELELYYQPQIDTCCRAIIGVEVLLRWQHSELGFISPAEFIPIAEETGLIIEIGKWSMEGACAQLKKWHEAINNNLRMSINLSVKQFYQPDLVDMVTNILERYNIPPECFELEFTESLSMHNSENFIRTVEHLKDINIHLSVDDFGTGYSSLSYLTQLPLDKIKIDRSFVKKMMNSKQDEIVIKTIIALAQNLGMQIIAEGVEEKKQAEFLEKHGCYQMQGYLFSKPVPAGEMEQLFMENQEGIRPFK